MRKPLVHRLARPADLALFRPVQRGRRYLPVCDEEGRLDFKEALQAMAERAGVKLEAYKAEKPQEKKPTSACADCWKRR